MSKIKNSIQTVNVIEHLDTNEANYSITSFPETPEGNAEAEEQFKKCITENGAGDDSEYIEECIENGIYELGTYRCILIHS